MEIKLRQQPHVFWLRDKTRRPVACIALVHSLLTNPADTGVLNVGVSTHNPHDAFNKQLGRGTAIDRAKTKPLFRLAPDQHEDAGISNTARALFVLATARKIVIPNRTRKAAKESLIRALGR